MVRSTTRYGLALKRLRKAKGLTQEELAKLAGITRQYVYAIETGKALAPGMTTLLKLARVLDASIDELMRLPQSVEETESSHGEEREEKDETRAQGRQSPPARE